MWNFQIYPLYNNNTCISKRLCSKTCFHKYLLNKIIGFYYLFTTNENLWKPLHYKASSINQILTIYNISDESKCQRRFYIIFFSQLCRPTSSLYWLCMCQLCKGHQLRTHTNQHCQHQKWRSQIKKKRPTISYRNILFIFKGFLFSFS